MAARWLDVDWDAVPPATDPAVQEWTRQTLARIAEGGREEEVAAWGQRMAERAAIIQTEDFERRLAKQERYG